jgi:integrase
MYCLENSVCKPSGELEMADLSRKRERERLKPRREPYWMRLSKGQYLGYRRGADTWIVRIRDRAGQQHYCALPSATNYDEAKKLAEKWIWQVGKAPDRKAIRGTVKDALETYLDWLRDQGRKSTAKNAVPKFRQVVWNDELANVPLHQLTREDFREWRDRLREGRLPRSINRIVRDVQAGLNRALVEGHVGDPMAWKLDPLADEVDEGGETAVMLAPSQRKALIKATSDAAGQFYRGLELTGARPGELAAAHVADLDLQHSTIRLSHRKGRPARLRTRAVFLSRSGLNFFRHQAKGKLPKAQLFTDATGRRWERHEWAEEFRNAAALVNVKARGNNRIPPGASAYSFRHARISELLQVHGVDPLTVANQTGTSFRMIERSYYRFIPAAMATKLAAIEDG